MTQMSDKDLVAIVARDRNRAEARWRRVMICVEGKAEALARIERCDRELAEIKAAMEMEADDAEAHPA